MKKLGFILIIIGLGASGVVEGRQVMVSPVATLRLVNPDDASDVRVLYKFKLPTELDGMTIVRSFVHIPAVAESSIPVVLFATDAAWSESDTWTTVGTSRGDLVPAGSRILRIAEEDQGVRVNLAKMVRAWRHDPDSNFGICVRRLPAQNNDMSKVLTKDLGSPRITIVYVRKRE